jgi:hypothetical protein
MIAKIIRQCYIPRKGRYLAEVDMSGAEVRVSSCYNLDPILIKYITDSSTDMHRDTAVQMFFLSKEEVDKKSSRDWCKNRFVFPEFYGSVYFQCAPHIWEECSLEKHKIPGSQESIIERLKKHGIKELGACNPKQKPKPGTFEYHVKKVEESFWNERFKVYTEWKNRWWRSYLKRGYFDFKTGFRCEGIFERNDVLNYAIQGGAFHCLLWGIIKLQKWLNKYKMKTLIVGEIHDSVVLDIPEDEIDDVLSKVQKIITEDLPKAWDWLIVPLAVEVEVSDKDQSWHAKRQWTQNGGGKWGPKAK